MSTCLGEAVVTPAKLRRRPRRGLILPLKGQYEIPESAPFAPHSRHTVREWGVFEKSGAKRKIFEHLFPQLTGGLMSDDVNRSLSAEVMKKLMMAGRTASGDSSLKRAVPPPLPTKLVVEVQAKGEAVGRVKTSKRLDLSKLPKTWRSMVFDQVKPDRPSRLASSVAILWATGCRPVEIEKGVLVKLENGVLVVEIRGAKTGPIPVMTPRDSNGKSETVAGDRGLEWRRIKLNPELNDATRYLARLCADGQTHTIDYNKNSLRTRLNEAGKLAIRKMPDGVTISPYTFRHALGSDLKSCDDYSDEEKSMVLGHLSCDSLSVYGRRRHKGGVKPIMAVEASAVPRGEYTDARAMPKKRKLKI